MKQFNYKNLIIFKIFILFFVLLFFIFSIKLHKHKNFYVTLTSWKGRINLISKNLENLLNQKEKPKKIILNLAIEEFPNKNSDLPKEILNLLKKNSIFEIFWVKKNTNVFKKLIPTINRFKKDLIITIDDDIFYPNDCFKKMIKCFNKLGGKNPVSFGTKYSDWNINGKTIYSHLGAGSIVKYDFFNNKLNEIYLNTTAGRINKGIKCPDDILYTYAALLNGYKYIRCKKYNIDLDSFHESNPKNSFSQNYNNNYSFYLKEFHIIIQNYIMEKYNISINKLIKNI